MKRNKIVSHRTCLYSNKEFEKNELTRLVKVNGKLIIDKNQDMLGRGYWIKLTKEALDDPKLIQILSKRIRTNIPLDLIEELRKLWIKKN